MQMMLDDAVVGVTDRVLGRVPNALCTLLLTSFRYGVNKSAPPPLPSAPPTHRRLLPEGFPPLARAAEYVARAAKIDYWI